MKKLGEYQTSADYKIKKSQEYIEQGYILAPYIPITTKTIISDENGTRTTWQIGYWMRLKLFVYGLFHKKKI